MTVEPTAAGQPPSHPEIVMVGKSRDGSGFTQIGTQLTVLPAVPAAPEVRYSLPPEAGSFTGRGDELDRITGASGTVAVCAISGMAGLGKTALAVRAAHLLGSDFPARQLFLDLHGHTPGKEPVHAQDALVGLLTATGLDPRSLPGDLSRLAEMWRDRTAGRRVLLVLDNAADSSQVAPLLPGGAASLVLVTSRRHLGDLPGAVLRIPLDGLPAPQAAEMFTRLAPRAAASPAEVSSLVALTGSLPLAISILARVFARHPSWALADLVAETRTGLLTLTAERDSVAVAFDVSYRHLDPATQRFFRLLGAHPGSTIDVYAAAALTATSRYEAVRQLDSLHGEGLLTETGYRRYGMHDLVRLYARELTAADIADSQLAVDRVVGYYHQAAHAAGPFLARSNLLRMPPITAAAAMPDLASPGQVLGWLRTERANLFACLDHVTRTGQYVRVIGLSTILGALLLHDGPWADAVARYQTACQAARALDDQVSEAAALTDLGDALRLAGDLRGAGEVLQQALDLHRDLGNQRGQAATLAHLGGVRRQTSDFSGAASALEAALGIYRDLGNQDGQAKVLTDLGEVRRQTSDFPGAERALRQALDLYRQLNYQDGQACALNWLGNVRQLTGAYRGAAEAYEEANAISAELGDRRHSANAFGGLGVVRLQTGDYPAAADSLQQSLDIYRDLGTEFGAATVLMWLGTVRRLTGDLPGATRALEQALETQRQLGNRFGEANALTALGAVRRLTGDLPGATRALEQSLETQRQLGNRFGEANALAALGAVRRLTGDLRRAADAVQQALDIYRSLGAPFGEAEALNERGTLYRLAGQLSRSEECHQQALTRSRALGTPWDEAHALAGLGRCARATDDLPGAASLLGQAHRILGRIGAADAAAVRAELRAIPATGGAGGAGGA